MKSLDDILKIQNFYDCMGYLGYISGKNEDRRKLFIIDVRPLKRKKDGVQFGYFVVTKSIGSGVESGFTIMNRVFNKKPITKGSIIYCKDYMRDGSYFEMIDYDIINRKE